MVPERQAVADQLQTAEELLQSASQMLEEELPCQKALLQLCAAQYTVEIACMQFLQAELESCLKIIREDPNSEQRCQRLELISHLYSLCLRTRTYQR